MSVPSFFSGMKTNRLLLLLGSGCAALLGIVLQNKGVLPLDLVSFLFFSFVLFLFALYRPGWAFLLFVGVLPLEIVNVAPVVLGGTMLRPYQWLAVLLLVAVAIRFVLKRLPFEMFRPRLFDGLPLLIVVGAFLALFGAPVLGVALKQALVLTSFILVYFLGRIFFRTWYDVCQALPFFLVSSVVVCGYAMWQNILFLSGGESFQVMVGRPNGTFPEADWLGFFMLLALGVGLALLVRSLRIFSETTLTGIWQRNLSVFASGAYVILVLVVLLLSVARSAWLGGLALTGVFFLGLLFSHGVRGARKRFKKAMLFFGVVATSFLVAASIVSVFHLSSFQFFNRLQSTGSGLQKITVACLKEVSLPEKISTVDELAALDCRQIDLEVIATEKSMGRFVGEVSRPDPNVAIRKQIYGKVWGVLKEHSVAGVGWGSAAFFLGADERGAGLNASNVFLEVWLGSGLLGLVAFVTLWFLLVFAAFKWYREATETPARIFALFLLATLSGMTVFNLFNSGILLGFFFVFLSVGALALERQEILWRK